jgi:hypothetical protein
MVYVALREGFQTEVMTRRAPLASAPGGNSERNDFFPKIRTHVILRKCCESAAR